MLSIHRNQGVGTIRRHRGIYDVLSVHRTSYGVTLDERGEVVVALDIVSDASGLDNVAVVQYTTRDGHERPVLAGETALLTLGRAVVADPSWLGAAFPGGLNASVFFSTLHPSTSYQSVTWPLRHGATAINSSRWLQNLATTLCTPPASSFVVDDSFCDGVRQRSRSLRFPLRAGGRPVAASLGLSAVTTVSQTEMEHVWIINLPDKNVSALACPDLDGWTDDNATQTLWLLGRSDRELHATGPTGSTEMELAASLSSCAMSDVRKDLASVYNFLDHDLTYQLSQRYRRDRFRRTLRTTPFLTPDSSWPYSWWFLKSLPFCCCWCNRAAASGACPVGIGGRGRRWSSSWQPAQSLSLALGSRTDKSTSATRGVPRLCKTGGALPSTKPSSCYSPQAKSTIVANSRSLKRFCT